MEARPPRGVSQLETTQDAELLLRFTRAGHEAGYPTADLEERVLALARTVGLEDTQISVTPTVIDLTVGPLRAQRSYTLRVRPNTVDLDRIARLDDLVQDILEDRLDTDRRPHLAGGNARPAAAATVADPARCAMRSRAQR